MEFQHLYKAIVDQAPDAIIFADPQGRIRLWNAGAEFIFGFCSAEALDQRLDLIIPEDLRKAHWAAFEFAMKAGHTKYGHKVMTTRSMNKKGERIYVNLSFSIVLDESGTPIGAMAQARDFTARYLEEKRLRKQVADLERGIKEGNL
jgi:PAS domain S-box-containing protein